MTNFFTKIKDGANRFFNKMSSDKGYFNKIGHTIRHGTKSIGKIGQFLLPVANLISPGLGTAIQSGVDIAQSLGNDLEKVAHNTAREHRKAFFGKKPLIPDVSYL